jgi:hypothetical protein
LLFGCDRGAAAATGATAAAPTTAAATAAAATAATGDELLELLCCSPLLAMLWEEAGNVAEPCRQLA